ncbi:GM25401 [Drosophila sechellia]|uniref:GM25401 n=1 Tax=Drosophila sechellia TaxID=7238 RepID=B4HGP9_DROSE|nr:GM25401 [Drosophila sechellia]
MLKRLLLLLLVLVLATPLMDLVVVVVVDAGKCHLLQSATTINIYDLMGEELAARSRDSGGGSSNY